MEHCVASPTPSHPSDNTASPCAKAAQRLIKYDAMSESDDNNVETATFRRLERLRELRIEHRDLDDVIQRLQLDLYVNEVQLRRLKKRKLLLKDQIARLESGLIPDLNA